MATRLVKATLLMFLFACPMSLLQPHSASYATVKSKASEAATMNVANPLTGNGSFYIGGCAVNSTFTVDINLTTVQNMIAWQFIMSWNNTALHYKQSWIPSANVFKPALDAGATPMPTNAVDYNVTSNTGYLTQAMTTLYTEHPSGSYPVNVTGIGLLCKINFTIAAPPAYSELTLFRVRPGGSPDYLDTKLLLLEDSQSSVPVDTPVFLTTGYVSSERSYTLTLESSAGGTTNPDPGSYVHLPGESVTLAAFPDRDYAFNYWEVDGFNESSLSQIEVRMISNHTVKALFLYDPAGVWTVDDDGSADFHSIGDAMNDSDVAYGDTVLVLPGVYHEHVRVKNGVILMGQDPILTIVDGDKHGCVITMDINAVVANLTVQNGDYGVNMSSPSSVAEFLGADLNNSRILNNNFGGVLMKKVSNCSLNNNMVANNTIFGVHVWDSVFNLFQNNSLRDSEYGIDIYGNSEGNVFRDNAMNDNKYGFGTIFRGETSQTSYAVWSNNDIDPSNEVNMKPLYLWRSRHNDIVPENASSVWLVDCDNVTIEGCHLSGNIEGILLINTNNSLIFNNTIAETVYGLNEKSRCFNNTFLANSVRDSIYGFCSLEGPRNLKMRNNTFTSNAVNFGLDTRPMGLWDNSELINDIDQSNTVDEKPIIFLANRSGTYVPANAGYVTLINCTDIVITGLNISNVLSGITVYGSIRVAIKNCVISSCAYGITVDQALTSSSETSQHTVTSYRPSIVGNFLTLNDISVRVQVEQGRIISNNITLTATGISIGHLTTESFICRNTITGCRELNSVSDMIPEMYIFHFPESSTERTSSAYITEAGIVMSGTSNVVLENTIASSKLGISTYGTDSPIPGEHNLISNNNFINNTVQAIADGMIGLIRLNDWNESYPHGGNYWSGYSTTDAFMGPLQNIPGGDDFGDLAFSVSPYSNDSYPLVRKHFVLPGDVNIDHSVNMTDLDTLITVFGTEYKEANYNINYDANYDFFLSMGDIATAALNYGRQVPSD